MAEKKYKPMLFSPDMVRAILDGRKTMTRRIIKESFNGCLTLGGPHPCPNNPVVTYPGQVLKSENEEEDDIVITDKEVRAYFHCSTLDSVAKCRWIVGDIIWVKETFAEFAGFAEKNDYVYRADGIFDTPAKEHLSGNKWKPSIFMPFKAARIFLEVKNIRVERLQDISKEDAVAEGIEFVENSHIAGGEQYTGNWYRNYLPTGYMSLRPKDSFQSLWQSINGKESWQSNPWCWIIEFEQSEPPPPLNQ